MHRLAVSTIEISSLSPKLSESSMHHLKVIRPNDGELVQLFDGAGHVRDYKWNSASRLLVPCGEVREFPRPRPLFLFACITKGSRWDWTIEKAVELGATKIVPVISARTIVRIAPNERIIKRERWLRVAEDAIRQSDASWMPEITPALDFPDALKMVSESNVFIGALISPPPPMLLGAAMAVSAKERERGFGIFIGPEGDFTPEEMEQLLKVAKPVSFGSSVLRAETAAIYALSVLSAVV